MFSVFEWFLLVLQCYAFDVIALSGEPGQNQVRELVDRKLVKAAPPPHPLVISLLAVPRRLFCFGSLVVLDVVCGYVFCCSC